MEKKCPRKKLILISFGTRPEFIKVKPIIEKLEIPHKLLFTGQHEDLLKNIDLTNFCAFRGVLAVAPIRIRD